MSLTMALIQSIQILKAAPNLDGLPSLLRKMVLEVAMVSYAVNISMSGCRITLKLEITHH
jgi:hypothetical protein